METKNLLMGTMTMYFLNGQEFLTWHLYPVNYYVRLKRIYFYNIFFSASELLYLIKI